MNEPRWVSIQSARGEALLELVSGVDLSDPGLVSYGSGMESAPGSAGTRARPPADVAVYRALVPARIRVGVAMESPLVQALSGR